MMKKFILFLLAACMLLATMSCTMIPPENDNVSDEQSADDDRPGSGETSTNPNSSSDISENDDGNGGGNDDIGNVGDGETSDITDNGSGVLVAYFSCTNTTRPLAEYIADSLEADLYEIVPSVEYTSADLNYNDDDSRSTKEMNDPDCRPEISGSVADMSKYDIVFIGYPIWWGEAPRIVSTFIESYDFSGKTIIPFCTSGGSGIGSSGAYLERLTSGAVWLSGRRFSGQATRSDMISWVNSLGLDVTAK